MTLSRLPATRQDPRWGAALTALSHAWEAAGPDQTLAALTRLTEDGQDPSGDAHAWLSRTAEYAGDLASGALILIRAGTATAAFTDLRKKMPAQRRAELAHLIEMEIAAKEGAA